LKPLIFGTNVAFATSIISLTGRTMDFLELIIIFWATIFAVSGSYLGHKSYKRKKELQNLFHN